METTQVEEKIINATIECIERFGIKGTTNRQIAAIAGVNSASVNYYFRSKENLINHCMKVTLNNAFDWKDISKLPGTTPRERCKAIFSDLLFGGLKFPGVSRAHFYDLIVDGNYTSIVVEKLNEFMENLVRDLKEKGANMPEDELYLACTQITSAVIMFILTPRLFEKKFGVDFSEQQTIQLFMDRMVDKLFD